jgi:flagellar basal-body rod protein FlgB
MEGSSLAHGALAANVVNGQTPNYHRTDVSFKEALAEASGDPSSSEELTLATTDPADFGAATPGDFEPAVTTDDTSKMRADGNNVDLDQEMAKLSMNADYGSMSAQFLKNQYAMYRQVIQE